ncbi:MAG: HAMP domain-containing histidine kinase [Bacteroidetes bacterium]|jgi:signal transduction histidine kinase|nr:HAMP domain-containing histidine kinase [Bacteroidota bacterium]
MMLVFSIGGITIYRSVKKVVALETDYALIYNFQIIEAALKKGQELEDLLTDKVYVNKLIGLPKIDSSFKFSDTIAIHPQLKRPEPHRKLTTSRLINEHGYHFQILEVFIEEGDVLDGVVNVITRLFLVLSIVILVFSFLISKKLFQPFQDILKRIGHFNLKSDEDLILPKTTTKEFKELNHFIESMTSKARQDYLSLKEFSENASHEMQTPIAVAKGKLELLLESEDLQPEHLKLIQSAQVSLSKLSKMGMALSLLTKIENQEFSNQEPINFSKIVESAIFDFKEICELKSLTIETNIAENIKLKIDGALADILVGNLLKNAVHHNWVKGHIKVTLNSDKLTISNSGEKPVIPTEQLFNRFTKNNQSSSTLGLGLSIVKKICEVSNLNIDYYYENEEHILKILFP